MPKRSGIRMTARIWKKLPGELLERVFTFLPVLELIRCCVLSKEWNKIISTRVEFGRLCFENAKGDNERNFIVGRCVQEFQQCCDLWSYYVTSVLDLKAQKWYSITHGANWHTLIVDPVDLELPKCFKSVFMCADKGLVCEFREFSITTRVTAMVPPCIEVFNPITRISICRVQLPPCYDRWEWATSIQPTHEKSLMAFAVDDVDLNRYTIFFLYSRNAGEIVMYIYESITSDHRWRIASDAPLQLDSAFACYFGCYAMYQGALYVLFVADTTTGRVFQIFSYKVVLDLWEDTGIRMHCNQAIVTSQLIVSDNRLFLVHWEVHELVSAFPRLHIDEVLLKNKALLLVSQITGELLSSVFSLPEPGSQGTWSWPKVEFRYPEIEVFGFDKSILLMSRKTGISIVYNLTTHVWSQLPGKNPLNPAEPGCQMWFGKPMSLRLPGLGPAQTMILPNRDASCGLGSP